MFKAIQRDNRTSLRALAKTFIGTGNDPAALLCLDHVFSHPLELRNLLLAKVQESLSLFLDYIRLLDQFRRDESLAEGSDRQRLFGFQALGEDRYLAPTYTLLHETLTNRSGSGRESTDGYRCGSDELSWGIVQLLSSRISYRTRVQNGACRDAHGFSPCLHLLVQDRCNPPEEMGPCTFQHIRLGQLTVDWYHARLRLVLLQFQILNLARCDDWHVRMYVPTHPTRDTCGYSLNVKVLAWDITLGTSSTLAKARVACES